MVSVLDVTSLRFPLVSCANEVGLCASIYHVCSVDVVNTDLLEPCCMCALISKGGLCSTDVSRCKSYQWHECFLFCSAHGD